MCAALTDCYSLRSYASVSFLICTRRHLKWPSAEYRDSHHHDAACDWNTALVSQALPHALYHTVMYAIQHRYNACDVMKLFPDPALALTHWDKLVAPFYRQIEPEAIFYTEESEGSWVKASEACMISESGHLQDVISKILLQSGKTSNLVKPPAHVLSSIQIHPPRKVSILHGRPEGGNLAQVIWGSCPPPPGI